MATKKKTKKKKKKPTISSSVPPSARPIAEHSSAALVSVSEKVASLHKFRRVREVLDQGQFDKVSAAWNEVKTALATIDAERKRNVAPLNKELKKINTKYREGKVPAEELLEHLDGLMQGYTARVRKAEQKKLEAKAKRAEKKGDLEVAEEIREEKALVVPETSAAGPKTRIVWKAEVDDAAKFLRAIAAGSLPMAHVEIKQNPIDMLARECQRDGEEIAPGIICRAITQFARA